MVQEMSHCRLRQTWKSAVRAHCLAQAPNILAARRAELADIEVRYDWIHRRAYRADVRPTRDILPQHFKIVSAGRPGATVRPQSHIGKRTRCVPMHFLAKVLFPNLVGWRTSRPARDESSILIRLVIFQLGVFDLAVTFNLVSLLTQYEILTALPLGRHPW